MMRSLVVKEDQRFGSVRILDNDGIKWFCGSDIAETMGYQVSTISIYIKNYVDAENQMIIYSGEFEEVKRKATFINEDGLKQLEKRNRKLPDGFLEWANEQSKRIEHVEVKEAVEDVKEKDESCFDAEGSKVSVFNNPAFGSIRTVDIDSEPWFVGRDVAQILGYTNTNKAIKDHVDEEDKRGNDSLPIPQTNMVLINESGLYSLILSSKLPKAKEFKRWVTSEVLPSVRKHGAFMTPDTIEKVLHNPDFIIQLATELKNEQEKNRNLTTTNAALIEKSSEWDHRAVLNALMRAYAKKMPGGVFAYAWDALYKELRYNAHIDVDIRFGKRKNEKERKIDMIKPSEMETVIKIAVAMCEKKDIDTGNVINEVNAGRYQEAV